MRRLAPALCVLAGCYGVPTVAFSGKYFQPIPAETEWKPGEIREVRVKRSDGTVERLGYVQLDRVRPGGYRDFRELYHIYDDTRDLIGRLEETGELYRISGPGQEEFLGRFDFLNALRRIYNFDARANVFVSGVDPYRGQ